MLAVREAKPVESGMENLPEFLSSLEKVIRPFPRAAVEEAIRRWDESAPWFLAALNRVADNPEDFPADYLFHEYALRLLAQFRDSRAYEPAVRLARHPNAEVILGDTITGDLGRLLATVSGGDCRPLRELVEDNKAGEYARAAGLTALGVLCQEGQLSRADFSKYLGSLFAGGLKKEPDFIWTALAEVCADFGFGEHEQAVREAWDAGLVDPFFDDWDHLESRMRSGRFDERESRKYRFFNDAISSLKGWYCFTPEAAREQEEPLGDEESPDDIPSWDEKLNEFARTPGPVRAALKVGRNDPCPCGSGKKSKKCCGT